MKFSRRQARKVAKNYRYWMRLFGTYLETENVYENDPMKITGAFVRRHIKPL